MQKHVNIKYDGPQDGATHVISGFLDENLPVKQNQLNK